MKKILLSTTALVSGGIPAQYSRLADIMSTFDYHVQRHQEGLIITKARQMGKTILTRNLGRLTATPK